MPQSVEYRRAANTALKRRQREAAKAELSAIRPPLEEAETCAEWTAKNVNLLAQSSAVPGPFIPWPHQVSWLNLPFLEDGPRSIVIQKNARAGYTKCLVAITAYGLLQGFNTLCLMPRLKDSISYRDDSLAPTLEEIYGKSSHLGLPWSKSEMHLRPTPDSPVYTARVGYGVSPDLRRIQCYFAMADELSAYPESPGDDGRLLERLNSRLRDSKGKLLVGSTPTKRGHDLLEQALADAALTFDWTWCCPSCAHFQPYEWDNLSDLGLACQRCGEAHSEAATRKNGRWTALDGETYILDDGVTLSEGTWPRNVAYRINALSMLDWEDLREEWRRAVKSPSAMITFRNEILGLHVGFSGKLVDAEELLDQRQTLASDPERCRTVGVDVGRESLYAVLVEWGNPSDETAHILDYAILDGDTDVPGKGAWEALAVKMARWKPHGGLIDAGYRGDGAYAFARTRRNWRAVKGLARPIERGGLYKVSRQKDKGYAELIVADTAQAKSILLSNRLSDDRRWFFFDNALDESFFHGFLSEQMQVEKGKTRWVKIQDENEPLDCIVYSFIAQRWLKSHRYWRPGSAERKPRPRRGMFRTIE